MTNLGVNEERSRTHVWMRGPESVTSVWEELRAELEARAATAPPGVNILVTGSSSMGKRALGLIIGDILRQNKRMISMTKSLGFKAVSEPGSEGLHVTLDLSEKPDAEQ